VDLWPNGVEGPLGGGVAPAEESARVLVDVVADPACGVVVVEWLTTLEAKVAAAVVRSRAPTTLRAYDWEDSALFCGQLGVASLPAVRAVVAGCMAEMADPPENRRLARVSNINRLLAACALLGASVRRTGLRMTWTSRATFTREQVGSPVRFRSDVPSGPRSHRALRRSVEYRLDVSPGGSERLTGDSTSDPFLYYRCSVHGLIRSLRPAARCTARRCSGHLTGEPSPDPGTVDLIADVAGWVGAPAP